MRSVEAPTPKETNGVYRQQILARFEKGNSLPKAQGNLQLTERLIRHGTMALASKSIPSYALFSPLRDVVIEIQTTEPAIALELYPELV